MSELIFNNNEVGKDDKEGQKKNGAMDVAFMMYLAK